MRLSNLLRYLAVLGLASSFKLSSEDCTVDSDKCLPAYLDQAIRSQRDVSYNISVDKLTNIGINLRTALFDQTGYTDKGLTALKQAMVIGFQNLVLDVYYSEERKKWQVCSGDRGVGCQSNVTLEAVYSTIRNHIDSTDNDVNGSILILMLNLHSIPKNKKTGPSSANSGNLSYSLDNYFEGRIYTPPELQRDRDEGSTVSELGGISHQGYPTAHDFLFDEFKRLFVIGRNVSLPAWYNLTAETDQMFVIDNDKTSAAYFGNRTFSLGYTSSSECNLTSSPEYFFDNVNTTASESLLAVEDTKSHPFNDSIMQDFVACGFVPVVNRPVNSVDSLLDNVDSSLWSWAVKEPRTIDKTTDSDGSSKLQAYRCAQLHPEGWKVGNCYEKLLPLCRYKNYAYQWVVGDTLTNYFEAITACPEGTDFSVPRTALQQTAARLTVEQWYNSRNDKRDDETDDSGEGKGPVGKTHKGFPVWIDMNSIATEACWVTGGPYANCQYNLRSYDRNQVRLLASAVVVAFLLVVLSLALRADRVPIRKNQARWRREMAKLNQEEYEGVPA